VSFTLTLPEASDAATVGGKGASLGELARAGIGVPAGFVVTVSGFAAAMAAIDPSGDLRAGISALDAADLAGLARAAAALRSRITAAPLPDAVMTAVVGAYGRLGGEEIMIDTDVAVRSSATMEDGAAASFAGLQDTYLGVCGPSSVLDHVRRCWASLYNDESVTYRRRLGLPEDSLGMAVVVQLMVRPRAAGVMFTRSPVSGDRSVVAIEGTWGLGSALVSGDVTPDSFVVSKITGEITGRRVSAKGRIHSFIPNGGGVTVGPTPASLVSQPCLSDDEIRTLAETGRRVEARYGCAQDIEWAVVSGAGAPSERIVMLQSRPETVWAARPGAPVAAPKPRPADHVLSLFGKPS
jgi:pyruvate, water dikinase